MNFFKRRVLLLRLAIYKLMSFLWIAAPLGTKRLFDITFSLLAVLMTLPVMILIAALVKLDGGPILFKQERIGKFGRRFNMYKFRSMCVDAEQRLQEVMKFNEKSDNITFKASNDPRITTVGKILRRTSLDELPQLFNVLEGKMSIVGPRPSLPREVQNYSFFHRKRFLAKPGLTCLWQVGERFGGFFEVGNRNEIDFEEQVQLDLSYIKKRSFFKDLWIIIKTIPAVFLGK